MTSGRGTSSGERQRAPLRIRSWVAITILAALCVVALFSLSNEWRSAQTPGQFAATMTETIYALCGILGSAAVVMRSRWARPLLVAWAICATATSGLAAHVWGGASVMASIGSAVAGAVICAALVMLALPLSLHKV